MLQDIYQIIATNQNDVGMFVALVFALFLVGNLLHVYVIEGGRWKYTKLGWFFSFIFALVACGVVIYHNLMWF